MAKHTTMDMKILLDNDDKSSLSSPAPAPCSSPPPLPCSPPSPPPSSSLIHQLPPSQNQTGLHVTWSSGSVLMVSIVLYFCFGLFGFWILEIFQIITYNKDWKDLLSVLYGFAGVATNLAAGVVFGKPYTPFFIYGIGWGASVVLCLTIPKLWEWCEKLCMLVLRIVMAIQYVWNGWRHRRAA